MSKSITSVFAAFVASLFFAFSASAQQTTTFDVPTDIKYEFVATQVHSGSLPVVWLNKESFNRLAKQSDVFISSGALCHSNGVMGTSFDLVYSLIKNGVMYKTSTDVRQLVVAAYAKTNYGTCEINNKKIVVTNWPK
jgi:hypothetical protein